MSDSDFSSDDENINVDSFVDASNNKHKVYQIQNVKDNTFKFVFMGLFDTVPNVSLGDFKITDDIHAYLYSNFVTEEDIRENTFLSMITMMIHKDGKLMNVCLGIDFDNPINLEQECIGSCFIAFIDENRNIGEILKKKLPYPGSDKIIYFLVNELKNEKIRDYIIN